MKIDLDSRPQEVEINILPMIDVIFCILTFFILAAVGLTRQQVIDLTLPSVDTSIPVTSNNERFYVSIDAQGQVFIDNINVSQAQLRDAVIRRQQIQPNSTFLLYADARARYADVLQVLDLLRAVGGDRVSLATLPTDASLDPTQGSQPGFGNPNSDATQPFGNPLGQPGAPTAPGTAPGGFPTSPTTPPTGTAPANPVPGQPSGTNQAPPTAPGGAPTAPNPADPGGGSSQSDDALIIPVQP